MGWPLEHSPAAWHPGLEGPQVILMVHHCKPVSPQEKVMGIKACLPTLKLFRMDDKFLDKAEGTFHKRKQKKVVFIEEDKISVEGVDT